MTSVARNIQRPIVTLEFCQPIAEGFVTPNFCTTARIQRWVYRGRESRNFISLRLCKHYWMHAPCWYCMAIRDVKLCHFIPQSPSLSSATRASEVDHRRERLHWLQRKLLFWKFLTRGEQKYRSNCYLIKWTPLRSIEKFTLAFTIEYIFSRPICEPVPDNLKKKKNDKN